MQFLKNLINITFGKNRKSNVKPKIIRCKLKLKLPRKKHLYGFICLYINNGGRTCELAALSVKLL